MYSNSKEVILPGSLENPYLTGKNFPTFPNFNSFDSIRRWTTDFKKSRGQIYSCISENGLFTILCKCRYIVR